jgi:hypothetical protein
MWSSGQAESPVSSNASTTLMQFQK